MLLTKKSKWRLIQVKIRINKFLADAGICSRRNAEPFILEGRVSVNKKTVTDLSLKIDSEKDKVVFDGQLVKTQSKYLYIILNKPVGYITSCKHKGEKTVLDLVNTTSRVFPVGRLDKDSCGLVFLTNDGNLAHKLAHPKYVHTKEYIVETNTHIDTEDLKKISKGILLDGKRTLPMKVAHISSKRFKFVLHEGKNRQIRRICFRFGAKVKNLKRVRIENLKLGNLKPGDFKLVSAADLKELKKRLNL